MQKTSVWVLAFLIRCVLICLGTYMSDPPALSMTDIDYLVVWDGICLAPVPSERPTYRYSPIFKVMYWPMCRWPAYGKLLYSISDLIFAWLAYRITGHSQRVHHLWLMNPFVIALSVRGSFDSIVQALLAWMLLTIKRRKYLISGFLLGLCIHLRIYPIIFTPFLLLYTLLDRKASQRELLNGIFRTGLLLFCTAISLFATTLISMLMDDGYLSSGLLYHVSGRVDHRHNLSILWGAQLACSKGKELFCWPYAKLFQTVILTALIIRRIAASRISEPIENEEDQSVSKQRYFYHQLLNDLDQACRAFVAFNSVVTAQYFSWTLATFTLSSNAVLNKRSCGRLVTFVCSLGFSLFISGALEFFGNTKYLSLITLANTIAMGSLLFL